MINYYQPYIRPFLRKETYTLPENCIQHYFHSWEDALWELLRNNNIAKGETLLFPNFYCMDVLDNVVKHGYKYQLYTLDENFNHDSNEIKLLITKYNPAIFVIFHACGITSTIFSDKELLEKIPTTTIILEDCVHRLINPEEIIFISHNHIIMDSLRKVSPLPGSCVYVEKTSQLINSPNITRKSQYTRSSKILFQLFRLTIQLSTYFNSAYIANFAHTKILKLHDDIIGDSWQSYIGDYSVLEQHKHIDFKKIEEKKKEQAILYAKLFEPLWKTNTNLYKINIPASDYKNLHVYPIGFKCSPNTSLEKFLLDHNASIWFKFPDCPWSADKSVLFLPLGFHISNNEIEKIVTLISQ